jgi:Flp pilus assembly protein TadG
MMAAGITGYGGYFWISHSVQQLANDSARAAIAGLDSAERASLAQQAVSSEQINYAGLDPSRIRVTEVDNATTLLVQVSYDASNSPFWALQGLAPMPSTTVVRQASIRLGGY